MQAILTKKTEEKQAGLSNHRDSQPFTCGGQGSGMSPGVPFFLQPKLSVSQPGDLSEQEADRVAEQVMRMPEPVVQRQCAACAAGGPPCSACEEEEAGSVSRKASGSAGLDVPASVRSVVGSPGTPLPASTRAFFEPRFGMDLSHVRVHTDGGAQQSAQDVQALAYTVGSHVVFGAGRYAPSSTEGRQLLAHELTHVAQQRSEDPLLCRKTASKTPCSVHVYDASNAKDTAVIPDDGSGIGVTSVADMVAKVNGYVDEEKNACSCVNRLEINGHGTDGYQSIGNGSLYVNDEKAIVYNSTDEHLDQLKKIKFCSSGLFMLLGCHVGQGNGKLLLSKLANRLPGKLIGGAKHFTAGTGLGKKKVTGEGDKPGESMSKRDPFLTSPYVRWHIVIGGKEYVIPGNETTSDESRAKLKAADKIKVKTPEGVEIIKK